MDKNELRVWRQCLNAGQLRAIGDWGIPESLIDEAKTSLGVHTLRGYFDAVYAILNTEYPVEYVLKNETLHWILGQSQDESSHHICTEHWLPNTRADIVWVSKDASRVYEIKTQYDSDDRITHQINEYAKIFDEIIFVTREGHSLKFAKSLPDYVGLISITASGAFQHLKLPKPHHETIVKSSLYRSLRLKEKRLFIKENLKEKMYRYQDERVILQQISTDAMAIHMRHYWSQRESIRPLQFLHVLPHSLYAAMFDYRLLIKQWKTIIQLLDQPFQQLESNDRGYYNHYE